MNEPKVVVILVNHNGKVLLKDCLPSILDSDYSNFEVVVVDCASKDGSAEFVQENFPEVHLLKMKKDRGLAAGNNLGVKFAFEISASYVICLNNDTEVDRRWIKEAVKFAEKDPLIGILSFIEYGNMTKTTYRDFLRAQNNFSKGEISYVSMGPGTTSFFMARTKLFKELGLFDEKYFAYGDDNDFEFRVIRAGFRLGYINVPVFHKGMGSFKPYSLRAAWLAMRGTLRLHLVHSSPLKVFQELKMMFNYACNPFLKYDKEDLHFRRFRPSNVYVNFIIFLRAMGWNIYNLRDVLRMRKNTTKTVNRVKGAK